MLLSEDNQKQTTGIEPALSAWEADVLPIYDVCEKTTPYRKTPSYDYEGLMGEGGFEPPKPKQQIYSLPHLTAPTELHQQTVAVVLCPDDSFIIS